MEDNVKVYYKAQVEAIEIVKEKKKNSSISVPCYPFEHSSVYYLHNHNTNLCFVKYKYFSIKISLNFALTLPLFCSVLVVFACIILDYEMIYFNR